MKKAKSMKATRSKTSLATQLQAVRLFETTENGSVLRWEAEPAISRTALPWERDYYALYCKVSIPGLAEPTEKQ